MLQKNWSGNGLEEDPREAQNWKELLDYIDNGFSSLRYVIHHHAIHIKHENFSKLAHDSLKIIRFKDEDE